MPKNNSLLMTLSTQGVIQDLEHQADKIFSYFITSEYSQSVLYAGNVSSLPWLVRTYRHDPIMLQQAVKETLDRLFKRYFDDVTNTVEAVQYDNADDGKYLVRVRSTVILDSQEYNLAREVKLIDGSFVSVVNLTQG